MQPFHHNAKPRLVEIHEDTTIKTAELKGIPVSIILADEETLNILNKAHSTFLCY